MLESEAEAKHYYIFSKQFQFSNKKFEKGAKYVWVVEASSTLNFFKIKFASL